jgi:hypothetical protein
MGMSISVNYKICVVKNQVANLLVLEVPTGHKKINVSGYI